jgi:hypothetical protein
MDIKAITNVNFNSEHRLLVANFKDIKISMAVARTSKFKIFKLQNKEIREEFQKKMKENL